jgi:hypothetical protein
MVQLVCAYCRVAVTRRSRRRRYCSPKCASESRRSRFIERFWSKVSLTNDATSCWDWTQGKDADGYGMFWFNGRNVRAHRFAWELENGAPPEGMLACHKCDRPSCVRNDGEYSHIFLGTCADNLRDASRKGRMASGTRNNIHRNPELVRGERSATAKLTTTQVIAIRDAFDGRRGSVTRLARQYGISTAHISRIVRGVAWGHVA